MILALREIKAGEEVTISYVDEEAPLDEVRQLGLARGRKGLLQLPPPL